MLLLYASRVASSIKLMPVDLSPVSVIRSIQSALKKRKRIGETGDPCEMPAFIMRGALVSLLKDSVVSRSFRKLAIHYIIYSRILHFFRLWSSLVCETLSNAPAMSKQSAVATCFRSALYTVCTCSTKSSRAVVVLRMRLALI